MRIDWNGHKLGYIAGQDNERISRLLDAGESLAASIVALRPDDRWAPVECAIVRAQPAA